MLRWMGFGLCAVLLAGCGAMPDFLKREETRTAAPVAAAPSPALTAPRPSAGARTAETLDTTTEAQRAAATAATVPVQVAPLGKVVVSLGDVTVPGFWLKSSLVSAPVPGLVKTAGGQTVQVDLLPGDGAAQLSLAAFRAAGLGLTDLPQVEVFPR